MLKALGLSIALFAAPQAALAQAAPAPAETPVAAAAAEQAAPAPAASPVAPPEATPPGTPERFAVAAGGYTPMKPTEGVGMPIAKGTGLQQQYSPTGQYARWIHDGPLLWIIGLISLFVLALLVWVMIRYNSRANPTPSKTSHNTLIEIVWTLVPVLILIGIAVPSIDLLAKQFKPAPAKALTIKVTGNQWNWTYTYPDNGGFEFNSFMLNEPNGPVINPSTRKLGELPSDGPAQLEVDNRLVVPAGEPIRLQITASDVIHSFAVPALWFKLDGVPGRINEKVLFVEKPGVYYGQCSELCGARHGYMPIAIEALPRPQYNAWVLTHQGGEIDGAPKPAETPDAAAAPAAAAPASPAPASPAAAAPASGA